MAEHTTLHLQSRSEIPRHLLRSLLSVHFRFRGWSRQELLLSISCPGHHCWVSRCNWKSYQKTCTSLEDFQRGLVQSVRRLVFQVGFCWGWCHVSRVDHWVDTKQQELGVLLLGEIKKKTVIIETFRITYPSILFEKNSSITRSTWHDLMTNSISRNGELYILRKDSGATGSSYLNVKNGSWLKISKKIQAFDCLNWCLQRAKWFENEKF